MTTVGRYLDLAGKACAEYHDKHVRNIPYIRDMQCDELWGFVYAKEKSAAWADPWDEMGTVWTFTGLDEDSKLIVSFVVRKKRGTKSATVFFKDLKSRLKRRPRIATDSLKSYGIAARRVFGTKAQVTQTRRV